MFHVTQERSKRQSWKKNAASNVGFRKFGGQLGKGKSQTQKAKNKPKGKKAMQQDASLLSTSSAATCAPHTRGEMQLKDSNTISNPLTTASEVMTQANSELAPLLSPTSSPIVTDNTNALGRNSVAATTPPAFVAVNAKQDTSPVVTKSTPKIVRFCIPSDEEREDVSFIEDASLIEVTHSAATPEIAARPSTPPLLCTTFASESESQEMSVVSTVESELIEGKKQHEEGNEALVNEEHEAETEKREEMSPTYDGNDSGSSHGAGALPEQPMAFPFPFPDHFMREGEEQHEQREFPDSTDTALQTIAQSAELQGVNNNSPVNAAGAGQFGQEGSVHTQSAGLNAEDDGTSDSVTVLTVPRSTKSLTQRELPTRSKLNSQSQRIDAQFTALRVPELRSTVKHRAKNAPSQSQTSGTEGSSTTENNSGKQIVHIRVTSGTSSNSVRSTGSNDSKAKSIASKKRLSSSRNESTDLGKTIQKRQMMNSKRWKDCSKVLDEIPGLPVSGDNGPEVGASDDERETDMNVSNDSTSANAKANAPKGQRPLGKEQESLQDTSRSKDNVFAPNTEVLAVAQTISSDDHPQHEANGTTGPNTSTSRVQAPKSSLGGVTSLSASISLLVEGGGDISKRKERSFSPSFPSNVRSPAAHLSKASPLFSRSLPLCSKVPSPPSSSFGIFNAASPSRATDTEPPLSASARQTAFEIRKKLSQSPLLSFSGGREDKFGSRRSHSDVSERTQYTSSNAPLNPPSTVASRGSSLGYVNDQFESQHWRSKSAEKGTPCTVAFVDPISGDIYEQPVEQEDASGLAQCVSAIKARSSSARNTERRSRTWNKSAEGPRARSSGSVTRRNEEELVTSSSTYLPGHILFSPVYEDILQSIPKENSTEFRKEALTLLFGSDQDNSNPVSGKKSQKTDQKVNQPVDDADISEKSLQLLALPPIVRALEALSSTVTHSSNMASSKPNKLSISSKHSHLSVDSTSNYMEGIRSGSFNLLGLEDCAAEFVEVHLLVTGPSIGITFERAKALEKRVSGGSASVNAIGTDPQMGDKRAISPGEAQLPRYMQSTGSFRMKRADCQDSKKKMTDRKKIAANPFPLKISALDASHPFHVFRILSPGNVLYAINERSLVNSSSDIALTRLQRAIRSASPDHPQYLTFLVTKASLVRSFALVSLASSAEAKNRLLGGALSDFAGQLSLHKPSAMSLDTVSKEMMEAASSTVFKSNLSDGTSVASNGASSDKQDTVIEKLTASSNSTISAPSGTVIEHSLASSIDSSSVREPVQSAVNDSKAAEEMSSSIPNPTRVNPLTVGSVRMSPFHIREREIQEEKRLRELGLWKGDNSKVQVSRGNALRNYLLHVDRGHKHKRTRTLENILALMSSEGGQSPSSQDSNGSRIDNRSPSGRNKHRLRRSQSTVSTERSKKHSQVVENLLNGELEVEVNASLPRLVSLPYKRASVLQEFRTRPAKREELRQLFASSKSKNGTSAPPQLLQARGSAGTHTCVVESTKNSGAGALPVADEEPPSNTAPKGMPYLYEIVLRDFTLPLGLVFGNEMSTADQSTRTAYVLQEIRDTPLSCELHVNLPFIGKVSLLSPGDELIAVNGEFVTTEQAVELGGPRRMLLNAVQGTSHRRILSEHEDSYRARLRSTSRNAQTVADVSESSTGHQKVAMERNTNLDSNSGAASNNSGKNLHSNQVDTQLPAVLVLTFLRWVSGEGAIRLEQIEHTLMQDWVLCRLDSCAPYAQSSSHGGSISPLLSVSTSPVALTVHMSSTSLDPLESIFPPAGMAKQVTAPNGTIRQEGDKKALSALSTSSSSTTRLRKERKGIGNRETSEQTLRLDSGIYTLSSHMAQAGLQQTDAETAGHSPSSSSILELPNLSYGCIASPTNSVISITVFDKSGPQLCAIPTERQVQLGTSNESQSKAEHTDETCPLTQSPTTSVAVWKRVLRPLSADVLSVHSGVLTGENTEVRTILSGTTDASIVEANVVTSDNSSSHLSRGQQRGPNSLSISSTSLNLLSATQGEVFAIENDQAVLLRPVVGAIAVVMDPKLPAPSSSSLSYSSHSLLSLRSLSDKSISTLPERDSTSGATRRVLSAGGLRKQALASQKTLSGEIADPTKDASHSTGADAFRSGSTISTVSSHEPSSSTVLSSTSSSPVSLTRLTTDTAQVVTVGEQNTHATIVPLDALLASVSTTSPLASAADVYSSSLSSASTQSTFVQHFHPLPIQIHLLRSPENLRTTTLSGSDMHKPRLSWAAMITAFPQVTPKSPLPQNAHNLSEVVEETIVPRLSTGIGTSEDYVIMNSSTTNVSTDSMSHMEITKDDSTPGSPKQQEGINILVVAGEEVSNTPTDDRSLRQLSCTSNTSQDALLKMVDPGLTLTEHVSAPTWEEAALGTANLSQVHVSSVHEPVADTVYADEVPKKIESCVEEKEQVLEAIKEESIEKDSHVLATSPNKDLNTFAEENVSVTLSVPNSSQVGYVEALDPGRELNPQEEFTKYSEQSSSESSIGSLEIAAEFMNTIPRLSFLSFSGNPMADLNKVPGPSRSSVLEATIPIGNAFSAIDAVGVSEGNTSLELYTAVGPMPLSRLTKSEKAEETRSCEERIPVPIAGVDRQTGGIHEGRPNQEVPNKSGGEGDKDLSGSTTGESSDAVSGTVSVQVSDADQRMTSNIGRQVGHSKSSNGSSVMSSDMATASYATSFDSVLEFDSTNSVAEAESTEQLNATSEIIPFPISKVSTSSLPSLSPWVMHNPSSSCDTSTSHFARASDPISPFSTTALGSSRILSFGNEECDICHEQRGLAGPDANDGFKSERSPPTRRRVTFDASILSPSSTSKSSAFQNNDQSTPTRAQVLSEYYEGLLERSPTKNLDSAMSYMDGHSGFPSHGPSLSATIPSNGRQESTSHTRGLSNARNDERVGNRRNLGKYGEEVLQMPETPTSEIAFASQSPKEGFQEGMADAMGRVVGTEKERNSIPE